MKLLLPPKLYLCIVFSVLWHITIGQRAMYVDDFDAILNSNVSRTQLLQYAQSHQITSLLLYDLHNVHNQHDLTNATTNQILADFIRNAKQNYGITKITAIAENAWFFKNRIMSYNGSRKANNEKFDVLGLEFEFWTPVFTKPGAVYCTDYLQPNKLSCDSTGAFTFCKSQLTQMKAMAKNSSYPMTVEMYVGWTTPSQLQAIADIADKTLIHAYVPDPKNAFSYALTRLQQYNTYKGVENVSIIYSAEPAFMQNWLNANTLADAEQKFMNDYNNASGAWKEHVNMEDFTYFTYSTMLNIPLPVQLSAFNGAIRGKDVLLDWRMENINKVAGFEVEFSFDGKQFDDIAFVPSNTSSKEYSYTTNPIAQSAYYRLKSIGKDGKSHYSDAIHVQDKSESVSVVSIFPNPASSSINIRTNITNDAGYQVFNHFGQVVLQGTRLPESLNVDELTSGLYVLNAGGVSTRFMKE